MRSADDEQYGYSIERRLKLNPKGGGAHCTSALSSAHSGWWTGVHCHLLAPPRCNRVRLAAHHCLVAAVGSAAIMALARGLFARKVLVGFRVVQHHCHRTVGQWLGLSRDDVISTIEVEKHMRGLKAGTRHRRRLPRTERFNGSSVAQRVNCCSTVQRLNLPTTLLHALHTLPPDPTTPQLQLRIPHPGCVLGYRPRSGMVLSPPSSRG